MNEIYIYIYIYIDIYILNEASYSRFVTRKWNIVNN